jgi:two-component system cell cycle response regulator
MYSRSRARPPRTVLVIDDSPTIRRVIAIELRSLGMQVIEAATAAEGVSRARDCSPDLISLDLQLPDASGYDVCEELNLYEETIGVPIIMISSQPSDKQRLHALAAGALEYFVKPFRSGELRRFVVEMFERLARNQSSQVYVADGSRPVRSMLERVLGASGYDCVTFDGAPTILEALRKKPCDLMLVDLELPHYAAFEMLTAIRGQPLFDSMPILALSASGSRKDLTTAFRAGANEVVRKPFFREELLVRIEGLLNVRNLTRQLHEDATLDPLTKLYNRRQLARLANAETSRALRDHQPLGALVVDVDHFKAVNDKHGHAVGDEVLRAVADALRQSARATDIVARYGGEEFVVLLPQGDEVGSRALAERLRRTVEAKVIATAAGPVSITISVGVTTWQSEELASGMSLDAIIKPADDALYESKRAGRNRATFAKRVKAAPSASAA